MIFNFSLIISQQQQIYFQLEGKFKDNLVNTDVSLNNPYYIASESKSDIKDYVITTT